MIPPGCPYQKLYPRRADSHGQQDGTQIGRKGRPAQAEVATARTVSVQSDALIAARMMVWGKRRKSLILRLGRNTVVDFVRRRADTRDEVRRRVVRQ